MTYNIKWSIKTGRKAGNIGETLFRVAEKDIETAREAVRQMAREFRGAEWTFKVRANVVS